MHPLLADTFGGLSVSYYVRQFLFGLAFSALIFFAASNGNGPIPGSLLPLLAVNTLLYPYARFAYERVVDFVIGENVFFINALIMLIVKLFTMAMCWSMAVFIAPLGLVFLYFHHRRARRQAS